MLPPRYEAAPAPVNVACGADSKRSSELAGRCKAETGREGGSRWKPVELTGRTTSGCCVRYPTDQANRMEMYSLWWLELDRRRSLQSADVGAACAAVPELCKTALRSTAQKLPCNMHTHTLSTKDSKIHTCSRAASPYARSGYSGAVEDIQLRPWNKPGLQHINSDNTL